MTTDDGAWERGVQDVIAAKEAVAAAYREQARVETECGNAARERDRHYPVLNEDEKTRITASREAVVEAKAAVDVADQAFKAGTA